MKRLLGAVVVIAVVAAAAWLYLPRDPAPPAGLLPVPEKADHRWVDQLYSRNPGEVEAATREVTRRGAGALPIIQAALRDPQSDRTADREARLE